MREIADIVNLFESRPRERFALATVFRTTGSSYRRPGARMLIAADGRTAGALSGGCLEEEVVAKAREVLMTPSSALMSFDTRRRFGCNGSLEIVVEPAGDEFLAALSCCFHARRPCLVATGERGSRMIGMADEAAADERVQRIVPPWRLLVVGDGPDSPALREIAEALGWRVFAFDNAGQLDAAYDEWTAAVVKTHNYGRDFAALRALLPLNLPYVGLIGPRARREQLAGDLIDTGIIPGENFFAPAGLDLGGDSPQAVAVSIVAEIQAVLAGGSCEHLRNRRAPIHPVAVAPITVVP